MRRSRRLARTFLFGTALLAAPLVAMAEHTFEGVDPNPGPNIIVIVSDDYAWPYYGFMQQYLERNHTDGVHGTAYAKDTEVGYPKHRYGTLLPNDPRVPPVLPKLETILTPALDSLARGQVNGNYAGQYFPIAHLGASICKPGLATSMSGLHMYDYNRNQAADDGTSVTSPVLPEHLQGFAWGNETTPPTQPGVAQYLTMGAGKWRYSRDTFRFDDAAADCDSDANTPMPPCQSTVAPEIPDKRPFDYDVFTGSDSAGTRDILLGRLQEMKDFIDCALCVNNGISCQTSSGYISSPRLAEWQGICNGLDGTATTPVHPRPFFMVYNPLIPHDPLETALYCPQFDVTAAGTPPVNLCNDPSRPWYGDYSAYCNHPTQGQYSCEDFSTHLFQIGCELEKVTFPGEPKGERNIYSTTTDCNNNAQPPYVASDFQRKGDYLRFINVFDRTVDELLVHLKRRGVYDKTMILVLTDNGATSNDMVHSKGQFFENGYRTPFILFDPYSTPPTPNPTAKGCDAIQGCRDDFAQFTDLVRTIREAQKDYAGLKGQPAPVLSTPLPQSKRTKLCGPGTPDPYGFIAGSSNESFDLRRSSTQGFGTGGRICPSGTPSDGDPTVVYKQCLFGHEKSGSSAQSIQPGKGWYVLAEIEENGNGIRHLCKYYREGSTTNERIYDLTCDPNEQINLKEGIDSNPDYDLGYCNNASMPPVDLAGTIGGKELCERQKQNLRQLLHDEVVCRRRWSVEADWDSLTPSVVDCVPPRTTPCL